MSIRETFTNSIPFAVINEYDKGALMQISTMLGHVNHIAYGSICELDIFTHLSDYVFRVRNFENTKSMRVTFFWKMVKIKSRLQKCSKNWGKVSCLWDNCIWIGIVKLSLWRTGYFSSAANVLTSSPKICMSIRETFSNSIDLSVVKEYDKSAVMQISTVLGHVYHVACRRVLWNGTF